MMMHMMPSIATSQPSQTITATSVLFTLFMVPPAVFMFRYHNQ